MNTEITEEKIYQTLDGSGLSYPNGKTLLEYKVVHDFEIDDDWVYDRMMKDRDVKNSKFYQIIKDKKVRVIMGDGFGVPTLYLSHWDCNSFTEDKDCGEHNISVTEWDVWCRLKRILFGSCFEGDVRTLVGEYWYINQELPYEDWSNGEKPEFNLEEEIEKLETIKN